MVRPLISEFDSVIAEPLNQERTLAKADVGQRAAHSKPHTLFPRLVGQRTGGQRRAGDDRAATRQECSATNQSRRRHTIPSYPDPSRGAQLIRWLTPGEHYRKTISSRQGGKGGIMRRFRGVPVLTLAVCLACHLAQAQSGTCNGLSLGPEASLDGFIPFPNDSLWNTNISA